MSLLKTAVGGLALALPLASHALDQWAAKVTAFSSQYSTTSWSAKQVLKAPDTTVYGDNATAWTTQRADDGAEFISVSYTTPVYATGATIRETWGYGFVTSVEAIDTSGVSHVVWSGTDTSVAGQINDFTVSWSRTPYLVAGLTVRINTALRAGWEEIDAIQLHGVEPLSGSIAARLDHTAQLVCTNTTTGQSLTTTLKGSGKTGPVTSWDCEQAGLLLGVGDGVSIQITSKIAN